MFTSGPDSTLHTTVYRKPIHTQTNPYSVTAMKICQLNTVCLTPSHTGPGQFVLPPAAPQGGGAHKQGSIQVQVPNWGHKKDSGPGQISNKVVHSPNPRQGVITTTATAPTTTTTSTWWFPTPRVSVKVLRTFVAR